jgi:hypothetical protein
MKPTDDDGEIPDDDPRRADRADRPATPPPNDTDRRERPHDESPAVAQDTDWSVFDPPEDLQLAERAHRDQPREPDPDRDLLGDELESPSASTPRLRSRLVAFAGVALTTLASQSSRPSR